MKRNKYLQTLFINERRKKRKNPPIPHRADGPRPIEQLELLWDEDPLFFAARLRAPRAGGDGPTAVFSCVVTAPEQRREEKKKKKESAETGGGVERSEATIETMSGNDRGPLASLFTNRRSRCCFNVACPTSVALLLLLNRACLLFPRVLWNSAINGKT